MPIQTYKCEEHGEFEVLQNIEAVVLPKAACPHGLNTIEFCALPSDWVPPKTSFSFADGGTGAQRSPQ